MDSDDEISTNKKIVIVTRKSDDEVSHQQLNDLEQNERRKSNSKLSISTLSESKRTIQSVRSAEENDVDLPSKGNHHKNAKPNEQATTKSTRRNSSRTLFSLRKTSDHSNKMKRSAREGDSASSADEDVDTASDVADKRKSMFPTKSQTARDDSKENIHTSEEEFPNSPRPAPHRESHASKILSDHQSALMRSLILHGKSMESVLKDDRSVGRASDNYGGGRDQEKLKLSSFLDVGSRSVMISTRGSLAQAPQESDDDGKSFATALDMDFDAIKSWSSKIYQQRPSVVMRVAVEDKPSVRSSKADKGTDGADGTTAPDDAKRATIVSTKGEPEKNKQEVKRADRRESKKQERKQSKIDEQNEGKRDKRARSSLLLRNENGMVAREKSKGRKSTDSQGKPERRSLLLRNESLKDGGAKNVETRPASTPEETRESMLLRNKSVDEKQKDKQGADQDDARKSSRQSSLMKDKGKIQEENARKSKDEAADGEKREGKRSTVGQDEDRKSARNSSVLKKKMSKEENAESDADKDKSKARPSTT